MGRCKICNTKGSDVAGHHELGACWIGGFHAFKRISRKSDVQRRIDNTFKPKRRKTPIGISRAEWKLSEVGTLPKV
jgi:hypothetical protein